MHPGPVSDDRFDLELVAVDGVAMESGDASGTQDVVEMHHARRADRGPQPPSWTTRLPRWVTHPPRIPTVALVAAAVIGLGIAVVVVAPEHSVVHPVSVAPDGSPPSIDPNVASRTAMVALADSSVQLSDYEVAGFYPHCPWGTEQYPDPALAVEATVRANLPSYSFVGVTRGIDAAGVCSLRIRETDAHGTVLVVGVDSPPTTGGTPGVVTQKNGARSVLDVVALTEDDWRLEVLATGATGAMPQVAALQRIVADPRMTW
jgi:hypothetical protein